MHSRCLSLAICVISSIGCLAVAAPTELPTGSQCASCHAGIEWIREPDTGMMQRILKLGRERGDPAGCIVCHGGKPISHDCQTCHDIIAQGTGKALSTLAPRVCPSNIWWTLAGCGRITNVLSAMMADWWIDKCGFERSTHHE